MNDVRTVAIVEPHYDDAWLSLGGTMLLHPDVQFVVVSMSRGPENPEPPTVEAALPNVRTCDLALRDLGWNRREVGRRRKEAGVADWRALFDLENGLGPGDLEARIEAQLPRQTDVLCLPLGLVHPMHQVASELRFERATLHYFEYPYGYFEGWQDALAERTEGRSETRIDIRAVAAQKRRVFERLYPDQLGVLDIPRCAARLEEMTHERVFGRARFV